MAALFDLLPHWLREWARIYLRPLAEVGVRRLLGALLRGALDTVLITSLPVAFIVHSNAVWENRYALSPAQQEQVVQWLDVSEAIARAENVPPVVPLVLWYKEAGLHAVNPDNCEGIMGLYTAVRTGQLPCFTPGPIDAREVARQLRLGAAIFREHCPEVRYDTVDPEVLKRCYLYYNAGSHSRLDPNRSGYVMNGYDEAHQNMLHFTHTGEVIRLQILGAWPVHIAIQTQMSQGPRAERASILMPPALTLREAFDRAWIRWFRSDEPALPPASAVRCRNPIVRDCFDVPHTGGDASLRPSISPLSEAVERAGELSCDLLPGVELEPAGTSTVVAPMPGRLTRYADQWGNLALQIENDEWTVWLTGLRSYLVSPGSVEAGRAIATIGGAGSDTPALTVSVFSRVNRRFVDPVAFLPVGSCPSLIQDRLGRERRNDTMDLLQLLKFLPALLGAIWALWLFFKKDLLSKGPLQVITYFIGVVISLWIIGWLVDAFLFRWVAERLAVAQQSQDIQAIEQISQDILRSAFGTPVAPQPTVYVPGVTPTATPPGQPSPVASPQPVPPPVQGVAPAPGERVHTVSSGENLYRISIQYGVSIQAIQQRNGLADPDQISAGQQLIIPGQ